MHANSLPRFGITRDHGAIPPAPYFCHRVHPRRANNSSTDHDDTGYDANPTAGWQRVQCGQERVAKSPVPDTACQSPRRKVRLVIRVDEGLGCRLPVSRARPVASAKDS